MSLADRLEVPDHVRDVDLDRIGSWRRRPVIRDLLSLPRRHPDECPELTSPSGEPPWRKRCFREVVYVFHVRVEGGERVAVVEGVVPQSSLNEWLDERFAEAKGVEEKLKEEEEEEEEGDDEEGKER